MRRLLAATLSTLCLAACHEPIEVGKPAPPAARLVCEELPAAPVLPPLKPFVASNGALVYSKAEVDARDAQIAPYIVNLRGAWFSCSSQLAWNRDYWAAN